MNQVPELSPAMRQRLGVELAKLIWPTAEVTAGSFELVDVCLFDKPNETRSGRNFDPFEDHAAAQRLVRWLSVNRWTPFLEELRGLLIDQTGRPVGLADFMLATPQQISLAACVALNLSLEDGV